jgi:hypothetical protein
MADPFIMLHRPDGVPFWIRSEEVRIIEPVLKADDPASDSGSYINESRYVRETPAEVHAIVLGARK